MQQIMREKIKNKGRLEHNICKISCNSLCYIKNNVYLCGATERIVKASIRFKSRIVHEGRFKGEQSPTLLHQPGGG